MTVIAVKINKDKIVIAGDSQTTWGNHKYPKHPSTDKELKSMGKIFQTNNMTFGCAGSVAHIGLLQMYAKTHKPKAMEHDFILEWFIEFKEFALKKASIAFNDIKLFGIIISENKVFSFYDFMEIREVLNFEAIGSGQWLAIGAMEIGASAKEAVRVAIKYDLYCGGETTELIIE